MLLCVYIFVTLIQPRYKYLLVLKTIKDIAAFILEY